jgi:hypothetical protein
VVGLGHGQLARGLLDVVEDLPVVGLDGVLVGCADLGEGVAGAMHQAALSQTVGEDLLDRADQPCGAVGDDQQRWAEAAGDQVAQEPQAGVGGFRIGAVQGKQDRPAVGGNAPGAQHRLGPGARVHLEVAGVQVQVLQLDLGQAAGPPGVELVLDGLADAADGRPRQRRLRSQRLGQGRLHVAGGQAAHVSADHQRLQRMGLGDVLAQQPGGERDLGAA